MICVCEICGKSFEGGSAAAKYCSDECRKVARMKNDAAIREKLKLKREREQRARFTGYDTQQKLGVSMGEVLKYMRKHDCQYVTAITNLENQRRAKL